MPKAVVNEAFEALEQASALLVLGSSLTVYSGYRFTKAAAAQGKPIVIVNFGPTRADPLATRKIQAQLGDTLQRVWERLL